MFQLIKNNLSQGCYTENSILKTIASTLVLTVSSGAHQLVEHGPHLLGRRHLEGGSDSRVDTYPSFNDVDKSS